MHYAILVDGGFARRKLGTKAQPAGIAEFRKLFAGIRHHEFLGGCRLHRIYFYDAKPLEGTETKPLQGGSINFGREPIALRSAQLYQALATEPYVALRIGETSFEGWTVSHRALEADTPTATVSASDLRPSITQKGVDMRIGMDIAALTLKKQAQIIVLVTGDSDFVPAMKFARREGAQLLLVHLGHRVKPAMLEHCDAVLTP